MSQKLYSGVRIANSPQAFKWSKAVRMWNLTEFEWSTQSCDHSKSRLNSPDFKWSWPKLFYIQTTNENYVNINDLG